MNTHIFTQINMITHIYLFQIRMQPVTEITTHIYVFEHLMKGKIVKKKIAILNVYQYAAKTNKACCSIEKRIQEKQAKLRKNDGIRNFIIVKQNASTHCVNSGARTNERQGSNFDAEKWRIMTDKI